ncbi:threonine--tRNA ligase [Pontibacter sp. G13]|uniref:threonine--tRNA ligase n=1 Tax=Pontibacter sp. G13 TaxID=3074898 RepID=UPI00288A5BE5|nr:threonine--tRNA ligase [Pontibacter sp. G13]WNJ21523.1 threonine--tRNA ligase [Pontibacter sp. G13]
MINIQLPDGSQRQFEPGVTGEAIARDISEGLARNALAIKVNGEVRDLNRTIDTDATVEILTWRDQDGKETLWHSSAHILAEALEALYPGIQLGFGPPIENGFYYDIDFGDYEFGAHDFAKVEKKFLELAKTGETFERQQISKADALAHYQQIGNEYKQELIDGLEDGNITFYHSGNFTDLCKGPHIPTSKVIKAVKLLNTAGAYWRGNENNKQLTRIYAISFPKKKELTDYLEMLEEAKKRDHRKIGKELDLFTFSDKVGMGLPLWMPKGTRLRETLVDFLKKVQEKEGYHQVVTPHIGKKDLYVTSGHYEKYGADSFQPILTPHEGEEFLLKPMNCPHHCEIYKARPHSYRDLPLRIAEFGTVYRYEQSGELHGLTRVRGFTQDDAHIFCRPDQVKDEFKKVIDIVLYIFRVLDFKDFKAQISLRDPDNPGKYFGSPEQWDLAEQAITEAAQEKGLETVTEYGEAAFYGPKLDFMVRDALRREWQLGTIQLDYQLPDRFELEYVGSDNEKHRPVMIHRAPFGSLERFVAVLIEHTAGDFPLWLAPSQAIILPIAEVFNDHCYALQERLQAAGIRVEVDGRNEKVGRKIRDAELNKYPYMLIVGENEMAEGAVSVRKRKEGDLGVMKEADYIEHFQTTIAEQLA